ncbi:MAG: TolC family protein [Candidatus Brocadiaceae bacterium]|nr:TolC family protein [Candidatus Brocadiaceae bacterium]
MVIKLKYILNVFVLLNILLYSKIDVDAKNAYVDALGEILKVVPSNAEILEDYVEEDKSYVAYNVEDTKFLNLTLKDAIILSLNNNYDLRIAKIVPKIKGKDIAVAKSVFDPILTITGERDVREEPRSNSLLTGTSGIIQRLNDNNNINATLEKPIETGAKITLSFDLLIRNFIDPATFQTINPMSQGTIEAKVSQPLLKNAGIFYNRSNIYIARNDKKKSVLELKETAIEVINTVQKTYWELVKAIEELRVRKKSLERAEDLLKKNKIQVEVGTLAPIELLVAEEGVASQIEGVVIAESDIKDREDDLKQVINLRANAGFSDISIVPLDKASFEINEISFDESIKIALANRPEFSAQGLDIKSAKIRVKQQRNQLLPRLDIEAGIRYNGMGGNVGNAIDATFSERFQDEFFGFTLEVPLGNREARNNYTKAMLEEKQTAFSIRKVEQEIVVEVRKAVRQIKTNAERIRASKKAKELAQERLKAEEKKFKVGRSTSLEVIRAQTDLAVSEGKATNAIADYQISLGNFDAVLGIILENNGIVIEGTGLVSKDSVSPGNFRNN